jgi:oligopeptide/dipeptide ABC transporter ATP-binding protein
MGNRPNQWCSLGEGETVVPLLEVRDLRTYFYTEAGVVRAVDGFSFGIEPEQTLGIVGESGCGKSLTALSILGLVGRPGKIVSGEILYNRQGEIIDLTKLNPKGKQMRSIRGNEIAMIFQDPMTSLDPVYTIGDQIMETLILHQHLDKKQARQRAIEMLREVRISLPEQRADEYPHQLSGGMRQRAMIAMALSCNPSLLIADEPTTALDVTIQAQVLDLIIDLKAEFKSAIILITHDLGVVAEIANELVVMYVGKGVEKSTVSNVFHSPKHPYTQGLMDSIPSITAPSGLKPIEGVVPDALNLPPGCRFEPRCPKAMEICKTDDPLLKEVAPNHWVSCWLYE